ncbi:hypothetical protein, partial [Myxococcus llanfairpwllgwyngyllgogerychwyrndrobwllllantysiliogogogochensis]|uniref:hypothetical protein n=2 Tax=Myxococcus TaxID=32 RepID=UPI001C66A539
RPPRPRRDQQHTPSDRNPKDFLQITINPIVFDTLIPHGVSVSRVRISPSVYARCFTEPTFRPEADFPASERGQH